eukprot:CCRYP_009066-RA/>CCRYP_009066-RA protein AED:0.48 eAED:0.78 QI:0/0/0/1/1/1/2/0/73
MQANETPAGHGAPESEKDGEESSQRHDHGWILPEIASLPVIATLHTLLAKYTYVQYALVHLQALGGDGKQKSV